jgi:hypothetical protein
MRAGLQAAIEAARDENEGYPKGSTVICAHCFVPLYLLTRSISPGQKALNSWDSYRPLSEGEIWTLRRQVPSVTAALKTWDINDVRAHVQSIPELKRYSPALCPNCQRSFVQVFAPDAAEVTDHAYTWRLVTIPPMSGPYPIRSANLAHLH